MPQPLVILNKAAIKQPLQTLHYEQFERKTENLTKLKTEAEDHLPPLNLMT